MSQVVVGVDESEGAAEALRWAAREADLHQWKLTAVMAWGLLDQHHVPPDPEFDAMVERLRAARDEVAAALGIDRGFLMPRSQLEELARLRPRSLEALSEVPGLRRWQIEAMGPEIVKAING